MHQMACSDEFLELGIVVQGGKQGAFEVPIVGVELKFPQTWHMIP